MRLGLLSHSTALPVVGFTATNLNSKGTSSLLLSIVTTHSLAWISSITIGDSIFQFPKASPLPQIPNTCLRCFRQGHIARKMILLSPGNADLGDFGVSFPLNAELYK